MDQRHPRGGDRAGIGALRRYSRPHSAAASRWRRGADKLLVPFGRIRDPRVGTEFATHETVKHSVREYARGDVTTNPEERFFEIHKRGMTRVYQHCREQHFQRALNEFAFRHNFRSKLRVDDAARAAIALKGIESSASGAGEYCPTIAGLCRCVGRHLGGAGAGARCQCGERASLLLAGVAVAAVLCAVRSFVMLALSDETVSLQAVLSWALGGVQPSSATMPASSMSAATRCAGATPNAWCIGSTPSPTTSTPLSSGCAD